MNVNHHTGCWEEANPCESLQCKENSAISVLQCPYSQKLEGTKTPLQCRRCDILGGCNWHFTECIVYSSRHKGVKQRRRDIIFLQWHALHYSCDIFSALLPHFTSHTVSLLTKFLIPASVGSICPAEFFSNIRFSLYEAQLSMFFKQQNEQELKELCSVSYLV